MSLLSIRLFASFNGKVILIPSYLLFSANLQRIHPDLQLLLKVRSKNHPGNRLFYFQISINGIFESHKAIPVSVTVVTVVAVLWKRPLRNFLFGIGISLHFVLI